jgi:dTMP kinase
MSKFIVIEGIDGAGTTTQSKAICQKLNKLYDVPTVWTHEPTNRPIGAFIREILQENVPCDGLGAWDPPPEAMALLFSADRVDHIENLVKPKLKEGHVISDRYFHSTLAYQSLTSERSFDGYLSWLKIINHFIIVPDLTIILRISAEESAKRREARNEKKEKYEENDLQVKLVEFYDGYLDTGMGDVVFVDGEQSRESVLSDCMELISSVIDSGD